MDLKQIAIDDGLQATLMRSKAQLAVAGRKMKTLRVIASDGRGDPGKRMFAQMSLEFCALRVDDLVRDLDATLCVLEVPRVGADVPCSGEACGAGFCEGGANDFTVSGKSKGGYECGATGQTGTV